MAASPPEKKTVWNEPMLIPSIGVAAGVLLESQIPFTFLDAALPGALFTLFALLPGPLARRRFSAGLACCTLGIAAAIFHRPGPPPIIDASASEAVILEGCVVEPSVFSENREQFTLELAPQARGRVSLNLREGQQPPRLHYGQRVEFEGRVRPPTTSATPAPSTSKATSPAATSTGTSPPAPAPRSASSTANAAPPPTPGSSASAPPPSTASNPSTPTTPTKAS